MHLISWHIEKLVCKHCSWLHSSRTTSHFIPATHISFTISFITHLRYYGKKISKETCTGTSTRQTTRTKSFNHYFQHDSLIHLNSAHLSCLSRIFYVVGARNRIDLCYVNHLSSIKLDCFLSCVFAVTEIKLANLTYLHSKTKVKYVRTFSVVSATYQSTH